MGRFAGPTRNPTTASGARTASYWPSWPSWADLARPPLLDTPEPALNQAFAWAAARSGGAVRADPGAELADWDATDFSLLEEDARTFRRVGPHTLKGAEAFLREVVAGLFGVRSDGEGGRFILAPWLPPGWRSMALRRVRCHRALVEIEVRPRAEWATVKLSLVFGPPIAVGLSVRNTGTVARVTVDEIALQGDRAVFTLSGEHEAMFFFEGVTP